MKVRNTLFLYIKGAIAKNDRIIVAILGATSEVATLKQALVEAEKRAATERTEREKYEAEVGKVRQELQALMKKHESLELDSMTRASELAVAIENAKSAKAESQKTLQELDAVKKNAAASDTLQGRSVNAPGELGIRVSNK